MSLLNIEKLYKEASAGDKLAEKELFRHLTDRFRLLAQLKIQQRIDSEDIVQEALMTIAGKYKDVTFHTSFAGWAYRVLDNKLRDYYKTRRRQKIKLDIVAAEATKNPVQELDVIAKEQMLDCLRKVGRANIRFSRILNLHYQGFTAVEICRKMDLKRNYFYVVLSRARTMLETCLKSGEVSDNE